MSNSDAGGVGGGAGSRNRLAPNANQMKRKLGNGPAAGRAPAGSKDKYVAEIFEIRLNPVVSKRGFLNFLEEKSIGWTKRYVVSKLRV